MNALKHAFPHGEGQITVTYESKAKQWKLSIGDDGVGLSATAARGEGLGTSIIESLARRKGSTGKYIARHGGLYQKRELLGCLKSRISLSNKVLSLGDRNRV